MTFIRKTEFKQNSRLAREQFRTTTFYDWKSSLHYRERAMTIYLQLGGTKHLQTEKFSMDSTNTSVEKWKPAMLLGQGDLGLQ